MDIKSRRLPALFLSNEVQFKKTPPSLLKQNGERSVCLFIIRSDKRDHVARVVTDSIAMIIQYSNIIADECKIEWIFK